MNKFTILLLAILISATGVSQGIDLGVKVGANFATLSDAENGPSSKTGFQAGIFAGLKLGDKIGIQADVLYSQQGAEFNATDFDLTYVNIPIVLKYYVIGGLNIQAGPQFGILVDDNIKELSSGILEAESSDISAVAGLGFDLPFGLRIDGRYTFGFTEVIKDAKGKNTVITLAVGYSFL
jgi:hypothetical protein